jgi:hypothetical protein
VVRVGHGVFWILMGMAGNREPLLHIFYAIEWLMFICALHHRSATLPSFNVAMD